MCIFLYVSKIFIDKICPKPHQIQTHHLLLPKIKYWRLEMICRSTNHYPVIWYYQSLILYFFLINRDGTKKSYENTFEFYVKIAPSKPCSFIFLLYTSLLIWLLLTPPIYLVSLHRILHGLMARGFQLAHWEPNYKGSELTTLAGLTFHVFSETLWVNPRYQQGKNDPTKGHPPPQLWRNFLQLSFPYCPFWIVFS